MSTRDYNAKLMEQIKKLETGLKNKIKRLKLRDDLTPYQEGEIDQSIMVLQEMQDLGLIVTWRWDL